jgi:hypothetical protein
MMVSSLYIAETGRPEPDKQFKLTLRIYDGVEVDKITVATFGYDTATALVSTKQVGWEEERPTMVECAHCRNIVTRPCVKMTDLEERAARFPKSLCVGRLEVAKALIGTMEGKP